MSRGCERGYRASKSFVSILSALDTVLCSVFLKASTLALALTPPIPNFLLSALPPTSPFSASCRPFFSPLFRFLFFSFLLLLPSPPPFFYSIPPPSQDRHKSKASLAFGHRVETSRNVGPVQRFFPAGKIEAKKMRTSVVDKQL